MGQFGAPWTDFSKICAKQKKKDRLWLVYIIPLITSMVIKNNHEIMKFPLQQWLSERAAVLRETFYL